MGEGGGLYEERTGVVGVERRRMDGCSWGERGEGGGEGVSVCERGGV